uniref:Golgin subfamily A member 7 n=2 Tax=Sus scrofa TaxID=9823 RepID=A0A5G2QGA7_PIG
MKIFGVGEKTTVTLGKVGRGCLIVKPVQVLAPLYLPPCCQTDQVSSLLSTSNCAPAISFVALGPTCKLRLPTKSENKPLKVVIRNYIAAINSAARLVLAMRPQQAPVSGKVFIQRDYSSGTRCQFQTKFPAELENRIDRQQFEETVRTLNNLYAEAEKLGGQSYLEGCLACLTAYTIFLCMETHYEKVLKKVSKYIQEQNEKIYAPQGLLLTDPIERGLRVNRGLF